MREKQTYGVIMLPAAQLNWQALKKWNYYKLINKQLESVLPQKSDVMVTQSKLV